MKRLFQPVAVLLVGLVAAQPALVCLLCAAPAAPCPMAITDMGPSCGSANPVDAGLSRLTGFVHATTRSMASVAVPAGPKAAALAGPDAPVEPLPEPHPALFAIGNAPTETSSPPIYPYCAENSVLQGGDAERGERSSP